MNTLDEQIAKLSGELKKNLELQTMSEIVCTDIFDPNEVTNIQICRSGMADSSKDLSKTPPGVEIFMRFSSKDNAYLSNFKKLDIFSRFDSREIESFDIMEYNMDCSADFEYAAKMVFYFAAEVYGLDSTVKLSYNTWADDVPQEYIDMLEIDDSTVDKLPELKSSDIKNMDSVNITASEKYTKDSNSIENRCPEKERLDNFTILSPSEERQYLIKNLRYLFKDGLYYLVPFDGMFFGENVCINVQCFNDGSGIIDFQIFSENQKLYHLDRLMVQYESSEKVLHMNSRCDYEFSNTHKILDNASLIAMTDHYGDKCNSEFKCRYDIPNLFLLINLFLFEKKELSDNEIDELYDTSFASIEAAVQKKNEREARKAEAERQRKINEEKAAPAPQANNGCYIATCVYGSYDCPEVWILRRFRDYTLDETWYGRAFIKTYYAISPTLVKWFGKTNWFKSLFKKPLDSFVNYLRGKGVSSSPYNDKY